MQVTNTVHNGRMAQRLRHPPTERGIPGSNPGVIGIFVFIYVLACVCHSLQNNKWYMRVRCPVISFTLFYQLQSVDKQDARHSTITCTDHFEWLCTNLSIACMYFLRTSKEEIQINVDIIG
jgi:hypothetical protein